jgi:hypothetical protein
VALLGRPLWVFWLSAGSLQCHHRAGGFALCQRSGLFVCFFVRFASLFVVLCVLFLFVVFCFVLLSAGSDLPFYVHRFLGVVSDTTASLAVVVVVLYILFFLYCLFLCFCSYQRLGGCIWFR